MHDTLLCSLHQRVSGSEDDKEFLSNGIFFLESKDIFMSSVPYLVRF